MQGWAAAKHYDTVCLTGPTGCGKSYIITALANLGVAHRKKVAIYCNRKLVIMQTHNNLRSHGVGHGIRAASMPDYRDPVCDVQICSIQTEGSRVLRSGRDELFDAEVVVADESHLQCSGESLEILQMHLARGAKIFGITATPLDMSHVYRKLEVFATNSEMFRIRKLVPALVKTIKEMDTSKLKPTKTGEYMEDDIVKECWSPSIVGHIFEDWKTLNPDARPMLCFAPSVATSTWVAKEFHKRGVRVAHMDASEIWIDGEVIKDNGDVRFQILDDVQSGRIKGVVNCQLLTEAIDLPNLYHLILARPIGSLRNAVQVFGRIMRHSASTPDSCLITDHAGVCRRHGSPNQDWDWERMFHMTEADIAKARKRETEKPEKKPIRCPHCGLMRASGEYCPAPPTGCGKKADKRTRMIVQNDGKLVELDDGPISAPRKEPAQENDRALSQKRWDQIYWGFKKSGKTFSQARGYFKFKYKMSPPSDLKNMPIDYDDWKRKISEVDFRSLR